MTALAMRTAERRQRRQPAARRGDARDVGADLAGRRRRDERPVRAITNGVHMPTWLSNEMARLFDEHLPADWRDRHDDPALWARVLDIPDEELWAARNALRSYLFAFIRERARQRWRDEQVSAARVVAAGTLLDPERADDRLRAPLHRLQAARADLPRPGAAAARSSTRRAGPCRSSSPARRIRPTRPASTTCSRSTGARSIRAFGGRIAFVDDYDLHVAHFLVQGCDVWLNNPRKPLEASGTSGMKASMNGVPHSRIGDGWWAEGLHRRERLADRRRRRQPTTRRRTRPTPTRSTTCSRPRSSRRSTSATTTASRAAGWRSCARRSSPWRRASARAAW